MQFKKLAGEKIANFTCHAERYFWLVVKPWWLGGKCIASHPEDPGSIPGEGKNLFVNSVKTEQFVWFSDDWDYFSVQYSDDWDFSPFGIQMIGKRTRHLKAEPFEN